MDRPEDLDRSIDRLAADWIALWESEFAALGQDAELAEAWSASVALMAAVWRAQAAQMAAQMAAQAAAAAQWRRHEPHPPRPPPLAAAPDAGSGEGHGGDDAAAPLRARLAELEQRLAALEGKPARGGADRRKPRKPRAPGAG